MRRSLSVFGQAFQRHLREIRLAPGRRSEDKPATRAAICPEMAAEAPTTGVISPK